ncbi:MAG TPA: hypothetical protein VMV00_03340 [Candidatus Baltobacteraceae bacterium]|nr:hypothetical protein [Candidatus Baltobacteraceae bacterium]
MFGDFTAAANIDDKGKVVDNKSKYADKGKNVDRSKHDGPVQLPQIKVQNIVVSADLHAVIDLYALSKEVKAVDYEPEQFPGAIFRIAEPKAVIILFKNGKMICTGTSTEANIRRVLEFASKVISKYVISLNVDLPPPKKVEGGKAPEKKGADGKAPQKRLPEKTLPAWKPSGKK